MATEERCPCGSGRALSACCGPLHAGKAAATAEALMRARYAAYVLGDTAYLRATWHPDTCPQELGGPTRWLGLRVLHCDGGQAGDSEGTVEFVAAFREAGRVRQLHETSRFVHQGGRWLYVDGDLQLRDVGRNEPCPCGSGRKLKHCCGKRVTASPSSGSTTPASGR
jgi:SEC-C motif-containing protein